jgi:hypothetical protein
MQKPSVQTKVTRNNILFIMLGYRKLTKQEVQIQLSLFYKKNKNPKHNKYTIMTLIGSDDY